MVYSVFRLSMCGVRALKVLVLARHGTGSMAAKPVGRPESLGLSSASCWQWSVFRVVRSKP